MKDCPPAEDPVKAVRVQIKVAQILFEPSGGRITRLRNCEQFRREIDACQVELCIEEGACKWFPVPAAQIQNVSSIRKRVQKPLQPNQLSPIAMAHIIIDVRLFTIGLPGRGHDGIRRIHNLSLIRHIEGLRLAPDLSNRRQFAFAP